MFAQISLLALGCAMLYIGVIERDWFNLLLGVLLLIKDGLNFYAAKTGMTVADRWSVWMKGRTSNNS